MGEVISGWITREQVEAVTSLLTDLGDEGWGIGTSQIIATHNLLLALNAGPQRALTTARLAEWIGPVVCKSQKQQAEFPVRLAAALKDVAPGSRPPVTTRRRHLHLAIVLAAMVFAILGGAWWIYRQMYPGQAVVNPVKHQTSTAATTGTTTTQPPIPRPVAPDPGSRADLWPFAASGAILIGLASWLAIRARREHRLRNVFAADDSVRDYFPSIGAMPLIDLEFRRAAQVMRRRFYEPGTEVDIIATVMETANHAGAFSPVFAPRARTPEYLVLIDQSTSGDIQATLFENVAKRLLAYGVAADVFFFDGDPRICWKPGRSSERFRFETIAASYSRHNLMIFSTGERFVDRLTDRMARWVQSFFATFRDAAVFTPRPVMQWDAMEWMLARSGAVILPASGAGIAVYVGRGEHASPVPFSTRGALVPHLLEEDEEMWVSGVEPSRDLVRQLMRDLELALGRDAMTWLAACAVYPGIDWAVLLYLGKALQIAGFEDNLLALARLPWFRRGYMPDWLRMRLLWTLDKEDERKVRETLFIMLDDAVFDKSGGKVRLAHYSDLARALGDGHELSEHVILDFMSGRHVTPLHLSIPERFALRVEEHLERYARRKNRRLAARWAMLLLAYFPGAGFFLARSSDADIRWHGRMGILTNCVTALAVLPVVAAALSIYSLEWTLWLFGLWPFWWPTLAIAIKRAPFNDRLRIVMLARVADEPPTGVLRWLPPFSVISIYDREPSNRWRGWSDIAIVTLLVLSVFGWDLVPVLPYILGLLYVVRFIRGWWAEAGGIGRLSAVFLAGAAGSLLAQGQIFASISEGGPLRYAILPPLLVGAIFGDRLKNHLRVATLALAVAGFAAVVAVLNHSELYVPLIVLCACAFALPSIVTLFGGAGGLREKTQRWLPTITAVSLMLGWALGAVAEKVVPWLMLIVTEVAFRVLRRRDEIPAELPRSTPQRNHFVLLCGLLLVASLLVAWLAATHLGTPRSRYSDVFIAHYPDRVLYSDRFHSLILLPLGALAALICFRMSIAFRVTIAMLALATATWVTPFFHFSIYDTPIPLHVAFWFAVTALISAAWLLPHSAPDGWRARFAAVCSAPLLWTLIEPFRKVLPQPPAANTMLLPVSLGIAAMILAWVMRRAEKSVVK